MPADYGLLQPNVRLNTPFENLSQVLQVRAQQENMRGLAEQRQAIAEQRRAQTELTRQTAEDIASTDAAYEGGGEFADIIARAPGHLQPIIAKQLNEASEFNTKAQDAKRAAEKAELDYGAHLASGVLYWQKDGPEALMGAAQTALAVAKKHGHDVSQIEQVIAQDPSKLQPMLEAIIAQQRGPQAPKADYTLGDSRISGETNQPIATAAPKVPKPASAQEFEYRNSLAPDQQAGYDAYQTADANRRRPVVNVSGGAAGAGDGLDEAGQELLATQYRVAGTSAIPTRISGSDRAKIINQAAAQMKVLGQSPAVAIQRQYAMKSDAASLGKISTMAATAGAFENKAIQQADLVRDLSARVNRTNFPVLNQALLAGKKDIIGDADTQLLFNALTTFTAEYAKIIEGSTGSAAGSTDAARKASASLAHAALSKDTLAKTLDLMQKEMRYTIQGYDATKDLITARMGGTPNTATPAVAAPAATGVPSYQDYLKKKGSH